MSTFTRVGVVTGANKGIGYAIVRQLALQYPSSPLNNGPMLIYLTARDSSRGHSAIDSLSSDPALKQAKALAADGGLSTIKFHTFDVTNQSTVSELSAHLKQAHPDGVDFFINNAAIALDGFNSDIVKRTFDTNYHATLDAAKTMMQSLNGEGRMINLASAASTLDRYSPAIRQRFLDAAAKGTMQDVDAVMQTFEDAVAQGTEKDAGFPSAAYAVSKGGLVAGGKVLGRQFGSEQGGKGLWSVDPGYVNTDMSKGNGTRTPDHGADTVVKLALKIVGEGGKGEFWRDGREVSWEGK